MAKFRFAVEDISGQTRTGFIQSESPDQAEEMIRSRGLRLLQLLPLDPTNSMQDQRGQQQLKSAESAQWWEEPSPLVPHPNGSNFLTRQRPRRAAATPSAAPAWVTEIDFDVTKQPLAAAPRPAAPLPPPPLEGKQARSPSQETAPVAARVAAFGPLNWALVGLGVLGLCLFRAQGASQSAGLHAHLPGAHKARQNLYKFTCSGKVTVLGSQDLSDMTVVLEFPQVPYRKVAAWGTLSHPQTESFDVPIEFMCTREPGWFQVRITKPNCRDALSYRLPMPDQDGKVIAPALVVARNGI